MRLLILLLFFYSAGFAQVRLISWNVQNLGSSKSDSIIAYMAQTVKDADIVALQEIVRGSGGAQSVARLAEQLNRTGTKWEYSVSGPTSTSAGSERYAFLWKPPSVRKIGKAWLDQNYSDVIIREPYLMTFSYRNKQFTVVSFHAVPKKKQPETEIKYLRFLPAKYPTQTLLFLGDFNCPQSHTVFNPLRKVGYQPVLANQKTTLKMKCSGFECLASEYDNIWLPKTFKIHSAGIIDFYKSFDSMEAARKISDHVPVTVMFTPN